MLLKLNKGKEMKFVMDEGDDLDSVILDKEEKTKKPQKGYDPVMELYKKFLNYVLVQSAGDPFIESRYKCMQLYSAL